MSILSTCEGTSQEDWIFALSRRYIVSSCTGSKECEREVLPQRFYEACDERLERDNIIGHHVSYFPEEVVTVCRSCHSRIHMDDSFCPELTPSQEEIDRFYE